MLPVAAAACLLGLADLASSSSAAPAHRTRRELVLSSYRDRWGWQLVVEMHGQKLSLYVFLNGKGKGRSRCDGRCREVWPPLIDRGQIVVHNRSCHRTGCHIDRRLLGSVKRRSGSLQVTYHGYPLYRYHKDTKTGEARGYGKYQFGGGWDVMLTDGSWPCVRGCSY